MSMDVTIPYRARCGSCPVHWCYVLKRHGCMVYKRKKDDLFFQKKKILNFKSFFMFLLFFGMNSQKQHTKERMKENLVCVTEQHYVSIFFTRLWSVRKPLLFDTQNPEISGFSTAHAYKYKTKRQWSETAEKWDFCWLVTRLPLY